MPKKDGYYYNMVHHPQHYASLDEIKRYKGPDIKYPGQYPIAKHRRHIEGSA